MTANQLHFPSSNLIGPKSAMEIHKQVERFWASESHGSGNPGDSSNSIEDQKAVEILEGMTRLENGRYEVGLLWSPWDPRTTGP